MIDGSQRLHSLEGLLSNALFLTLDLTKSQIHVEHGWQPVLQEVALDLNLHQLGSRLPLYGKALEQALGPELCISTGLVAIFSQSLNWSAYAC